MGFPMTYNRFIHRNRLTGDYSDGQEFPNDPKPLLAGDLRRLEIDSRNDEIIAIYADAAVITPEQARIVLDAFFDGFSMII